MHHFERKTEQEHFFFLRVRGGKIPSFQKAFEDMLHLHLTRALSERGKNNLVNNRGVEMKPVVKHTEKLTVSL